MQLNPPAQEGEMRRRLRGLLVWSGLTLLAALALELGSGPAPPPPTSPIQFNLPGGHPMAQ